MVEIGLKCILIASLVSEQALKFTNQVIKNIFVALKNRTKKILIVGENE
jgi:hypothetical protein